MCYYTVAIRKMAHVSFDVSTSGSIPDYSNINTHYIDKPNYTTPFPDDPTFPNADAFSNVNHHKWFTRDVNEDCEPMPMIPPCVHDECFAHNFTNSSVGPDLKNSGTKVFCRHNLVCVSDETVGATMSRRTFDLVPYVLSSINTLSPHLRNLVLSQQDEIMTNKKFVYQSCKDYNVQSMKDMDTLRNAFIAKHWPDYNKMTIDVSHPSEMNLPTCIDDAKWPRSVSPDAPKNINWCISSHKYPFPARNNEFDNKVETMNGVIRVNKKKETYVDFRFRYPRQGCWDEFKNGFCAEVACTKMHSTFHGAASILNVTRMSMVFPEENFPIENWRENLVPVNIVENPIPNVAPIMTREGVLKLQTMLVMYVLSGEPIPVNPKVVSQLPSDPFAKETRDFSWSESMLTSEEPDGVEFLLMEILAVSDIKEFFADNVKWRYNVALPSDLRTALSQESADTWNVDLLMKSTAVYELARSSSPIPLS